MKIFFRVVALMCLALPLSVSGAQEKVFVGVIYGDSARTIEGLSLDLLGTRFAIEDLNRKGGLMGKQIDLVELNNNDKPLGSRKAAERAIKSGVIAVIGPGSSSHAILAGTVLQEAGIPMIASFATNPDVTLVGDYIFRVCFQDRHQGQALANFATNDMKAKTAVVLTCIEEKYSLGLSDFFKSYYRKNGGTILWEGEYLNSFSDFRQLLEKAAGYQPAVIFLPGYEKASGYIIRQSRNMGQNVTFLGADAWSHGLYEYGGNAIDGCYYSGAWYPDPENKMSLEFIRRYENRFQMEEITSFGLSRDAVFLLADAVRRADSLEPSSIRDALAATKNFQGVTGTITIDDNGDPVKPIPIFKFEEEGNSVYIKTETP